MRVLINCCLAGFLGVFAVGCAPPGQRPLRIRIEQDGSQIAEGIRGVSDSATVDEFNAALETGGVLVGEKVTLEFEVSAIREALLVGSLNAAAARGIHGVLPVRHRTPRYRFQW